MICTEFYIEFSCINLIQGSSHWPTLRSLSYNNLGNIYLLNLMKKWQKFWTQAKVDISRILPPIPSKPSKSILAKLNTLKRLNFWILTTNYFLALTISFTLRLPKTILIISSKLRKCFISCSQTRLLKFIISPITKKSKESQKSTWLLKIYLESRS